jgi:RNA-directed DNA polymerase
MNLATPTSVQKLQTVLHDKAKESPDRRFHALYDRVYRKDVLTFAYQSMLQSQWRSSRGRRPDF